MAAPSASQRSSQRGPPSQQRARGDSTQAGRSPPSRKAAPAAEKSKAKASNSVSLRKAKLDKHDANLLQDVSALARSPPAPPLGLRRFRRHARARGADASASPPPHLRRRTPPPQVHLDDDALATIPDQIRTGLHKRYLRVVDIFHQYDDSGDGLIDAAEFGKALRELGLRDASDADIGAVFNSMDPDGSGEIEFRELHDLLVRSVQNHPRLEPLEVKAKNTISLRKEGLKKNDANLLQGLDLTSGEGTVPDKIRAALKKRHVRVVDILRQFDDDDTGVIDAAEFSKALRELGLRDASDADLGAIFESFDPDGSGEIDFRELHDLLVRSVQNHPRLEPLEVKARNKVSLRKEALKKNDANLLQGLDLCSGGGTVPDQIRTFLNSRLLRVVDVFRQFDDDDSGRIDAAEFIKAMREMGLRGDAATDENVGAVFASFDPDASGTIEYAELHDLLVRSVQHHPKLEPLELTAKNRIALRKGGVPRLNANLFQGLDLDASSLDSIPHQLRAHLHKRLAKV